MNNITTNRLSHAYSVYGFNVSSQLELPELISGAGTADICIHCGKVPDFISNPTQNNSYFQTSESELLFKVAGVGKYYVANGNLIIVEPEDRANFNAVKLFLLGSAFGALLLQRGVLPIHGSAVVIDGKCVIFTGESGAGKSTLSSSFIEKGYEILSDDVAALTFHSDGVIKVQPGYPQQKLWKDCIENMGRDVDAFDQISNEIDKYAVPVHKGFTTSSVPLAAICELKPEDRDDVSITPITGGHKLSLVMNNTYRVQLIHFFKHNIQHFRQCSLIADKIRAFRLVRPKNKYSMNEQIKSVLEQLASA